jgi:hypothetical protein
LFGEHDIDRFPHAAARRGARWPVELAQALHLAARSDRLWGLVLWRESGWSYDN